MKETLETVPLAREAARRAPRPPGAAALAEELAAAACEGGKPCGGHDR